MADTFLIVDGNSLMHRAYHALPLMDAEGTYTNATYVTLRSGGQTLVTFLFDSCFVWVCCVPTAFCLSRFTGIGIIPLFAICQALDLIKCALGAYMLKQGKWIQNLTV